MRIKKMLSFLFECESKVIYLLFLFYMLGFFFGTVYSVKNGVQALSFDLNYYFKETIIEVLLKNIIILFILFLSGFAAFGLPIVLFTLLYAGMSLGVLCAAIVLVYGFKGSFIFALICFIYFAVMLICYVFVSFSSLRLSLVLLNVFRNNSKYISPRVYSLPHIIKFFVFSAVLFLSSVYYVYVAKTFLKILL